MKITDLISVAFYNIKANKDISKKIVYGMSMIIILLLCFTVIIYSFYEHRTSFNKKYQSDCYFFLNIVEQDMTRNRIRELLYKDWNDVKQYSSDNIITICNIMNKSGKARATAGKMKVILAGKQYKANFSFRTIGSQSLVENINNSNSVIEFAAYDKGMNIFPSFIDDKIVGKYPESEGEIMLDSYFLDVFGIRDPIERILGSKVSFLCIDDKKQKCLLENYKITGVFESDLLEKRESNYTSDLHLEHIYVNLKHKDNINFKISHGSSRYYFDDYSKFMENYSRPEKLIDLDVQSILSNEGGVQVTPKAVEYCAIYFLMGNVGKVLIIVAVVIALIILFSLLFLFEFYANRQKDYKIMLGYIGMKKFHKKVLSAVELLIFLLISFVLGGYFSIILLRIINYVTTISLNFSIKIW